MPRTKMIENAGDIYDIINRCDVCYVGMTDPDNKPYVLPFNFGFRDQTLYLHSARAGKKMDILKLNGNVCIAMSTDHRLRHSNEEVACSYGMKFRSVVIHGRVQFIEDFGRKQEIMNIIMQKYTGREFTFRAPAINEVAVYEVKIEELTGRASGY